MTPTTAPPPRVSTPPDTLRELYDEHAADVFRLAYRLTGSAADAEDVVQDLFVALPDALRGYEERGRLGAWLRSVAARIALGRLRVRRRRAEVPIEEADALATPDGASLAAIDVRRALDLLPEKLRVVIVLKELEGYSHAEIADALGIREGASKVRLHRAREALRQILARQA